MVLSLYENFKELGQKTKIPENTKIQLISKDGAINNANNLFLSKTFPSGKLTEILFGDMFENNEFLANIELFDFDKNENIEQIEGFFLWLGVNRFTKFSKQTQDSNYDQFLLKSAKRPASFSSFSFEMHSISNFENVRNISKEKFIVWALKDYTLREEFYKRHEVKYIKGSGWVPHHFTYDAPSYVLYQLASSNLFKDYLITTEKLSKLVNEFTIDYNCELFKNFGIKKSDIESLILKIGAVDKFELLSTEVVKKIIRDLPAKSKSGKQTLTIYKEAIEHYKLNNKPLDNNEILLAAKIEDELDYFPQSEIYYNGTINLPKKITKSKAILNFPRRQNTSKVIEFFGINDLSTINIVITKHTINNDLTKSLQNLLKKIITYILVYRFEDSTTESSRKKDLSNIKNISIQLYDQVIYKIDDESFELDNT